jgi:predicted nuclease with RNAse H fold
LADIDAHGAVLGIDVGFSPRKKTTGFCALRWDECRIEVCFEVTTSDPEVRRRALSGLAGGDELVAVAIDGPLTNGLRIVRHYRACEAVLSRGVLQKRGKPGQTSSPVGQELHRHATDLAKLALELTDVRVSSHQEPIHERGVVEAFPNLFMAALIDEARLPRLRRDASDRYWEVLVNGSNRLAELFDYLVPGRHLEVDLRDIRDHEHRAALVCALTGLCIAAGEYVAAGDREDGDIVLPPRRSWGSGKDGSAAWLDVVLTANLEQLQGGRPNHPNHARARIIREPG